MTLAISRVGGRGVPNGTFEWTRFAGRTLFRLGALSCLGGGGGHEGREAASRMGVGSSGVAGSLSEVLL